MSHIKGSGVQAEAVEAKAETPQQKVDRLIDESSSLRNTNLPQAIQLAEQALSLAESSAYLTGRVKSLALLGTFHQRTALYAQSLNAFALAIDLSRQLFPSASDLDANLLAGICLTCFYMGDYAKALEYGQQSLWSCEQSGNDHRAGTVLNYIGNIYREMGDVQEASRCYHESLARKRACGDKAGEAYPLSGLGNLYLDDGKYLRALTFHQKALFIWCRTSDRKNMAVALHNIGEIHFKMKRFEAAATFFSRAIHLAKSMGDRRSEAFLLLAQGGLAAAQGRRKVAIKQFKQALALGTEAGIPDVCYKCHRCLSDAYQHARQYKRALEHYQAYHQIRHRLLGEEAAVKLKNMQASTDFERSQREADLYRLKNEQLQSGLNRKNDELGTLAMRLVRLNELLDRLRRQAIELGHAKSRRGSTQILKTLLYQLDSARRSSSDRNAFDQQFTELHPTFKSALMHACPALTPAELRLCVLIKLNLSSKDISNLLYCTIRNVETHRYHIRKKLGLAPDASLAAFLEAF